MWALIAQIPEAAASAKSQGRAIKIVTAGFFWLHAFLGSIDRPANETLLTLSAEFRPNLAKCWSEIAPIGNEVASHLRAEALGSTARGPIVVQHQCVARVTH